MSKRRVVITGLGPLSGLGAGIDATWRQVLAGASAIGPITAFDASSFACRIAAEVKDFKVTNYVPKSYRKAVKVMARDIELAVAAADLAARDAKLTTKGTIGESGGENGEAGQAKPSYDPPRFGAHIGAGLIAADLNELTEAMSYAQDGKGGLDLHRWGQEGMTHLTPLWLLKYLPNMLACHVTIIHDAQGPSNTITCAEASSGLSLGESLHVIERGAADACFCGGTESKLNPMAFLRQIMTGRINTTDNDRPHQAVRPFDPRANGMVIGEGGAIVVLEALDTFKTRQAGQPEARAYAEVLGFGASQTINPATRNLMPDAEGKGIALAIRAALRDANIGPEAIDLIIPFGLGVPEFDRAELAAIQGILGAHAESVTMAPLKPLVGNCGAGAGGLDVCVAAKAIAEQTLPMAGGERRTIRAALTVNTSLGGQNAAIVLGRIN